ncbi:MAG TPA: FUSC family protein [Chloroflexota bacterium]
MEATRDGGTQPNQAARPGARAIWAWPRLPPDPGFAGLRRAARAALVASGAFALAKLVGSDPQFSTFLVFGCFALIVLGDFGGLRPARAAAYSGATLIGAGLVALGTLLSPVPWQAALGMFGVGFCVQFAGVFGSYAAAGQTALQLSFVLAASIPAPDGSLGARLAGWCCAGVLATLACVFLWPRFERDSLRREAALACRAVAALVEAERQGFAQPEILARRETARTAVDALRRSYAATPKRPAGPARRDRAFVELLGELERMLNLVTGLLDPLLRARHPCLDTGKVLAGTMTRALEASADLLVGRGGPPDLAALQAARLAHRQALDRWAETELESGGEPATILDSLQADDALRIVSYLALAAAANAVIVTGGQVDASLHLPVETPRRPGIAGLLARVVSTVRTYLVPNSPVLHGSLRVGLGLAMAVLLSRQLRLDHGFWVVLATLSVLRTNALATGRTTVQALAGTTAGFVISAIFTVVAGLHPTVLWISLPAAIFVASYAASAFGFVAGQAAFTVTVVILFNLLSPAGWQLGLVRVEDVAIGATISIVIGLLLWPRGARGEFRREMAELFEAVGQFLSRTFDHALQHGTRDEVLVARDRAARAHARAGEAFDRLLREHGAHSLEPRQAAAMVASGGHALVAGDLLSVMAEKGYHASGDARELADLHAEAHALVATFERLATYLRTMRPVESGTRLSDDRIRAANLRLLRDWRTRAADVRTAIMAVTLAEWLQFLNQLTAGLEQPVAATIQAARIPWWR